jgi:hypothetical protein
VKARPATALLGELAELRSSIDREVAAIVAALTDPAGGSEDPAAQLEEHAELVRQLSALRERVSRAEARVCDARELRAELATLLFFARTLRSDAEILRATFRKAVEELARQQTAARLERERLAAERQKALRLRDALQARIVQTAEEIAQGDRTECRRTVPVITLDQGVTVCSVAVATPKRRFRTRHFWLVTFTDGWDDVLVRRA